MGFPLVVALTHVTYYLMWVRFHLQRSRLNMGGGNGNSNTPV